MFVLIPGIGALVLAWRAYEANGRRFSGGVAAPLAGGLVLVLLAGALFFNLNWGLFWPVILIVIGIGLLVRGWWSS